MKFQIAILLIFLGSIIFNPFENSKFSATNIEEESMIIRLVEIEIDSLYIDKYSAILKEESEASIRLEPGVIAIYPMYQKDNPTQIRLLEIYASREAYQSHIKTAHFKKYKTSTLKMVKSLKLIDMEAIDQESMPLIFNKIRQ